jgi:hypothetical protein
MHPSLVLSDEMSPEKQQIFEEMYEFCMNDDWEGIGPISNLNDRKASSTPPISIAHVEAVSLVPAVSTVESVSLIEPSNQITSATPDTSVSPFELNKANTSFTLATSVALDPSSGFRPPIPTASTSEAVVVFKYPIGNSRAQHEEQPSNQNAKRITKKKQDGQDIRTQKMEKAKTSLKVVLPPTPQSQPRCTATFRTAASALTARYDPSIHQLQVSYEMKQRQARMEFQDKLLAQHQQSQECQIIPQNQHPQQQHVVLNQQPQQQQASLHLQHRQTIMQTQPAQQPQVAQQNLPVEQQPKHLKIRQQLSLHSENLNIAHQKMLQENEALLRQPADYQQRRLFQQKYQALMQECREHKIRIAQFHEFKNQASSQQQLREARKIQATQILAASQSPAVNYLTTPYTNQTHSISTVSSTAAHLQAMSYPTPPGVNHTQPTSTISSSAAPKRNYSFMTTVGPDTKIVANSSNHGKYSVTSSGDHTYLNGPQTKKYKYAL